MISLSSSGGVLLDWYLFWTAFGAIGTTIGSLITAIAVAVAVRQYRAPLVKRLKISFNSAFVGDTDLFSIDVSNAGIRPVNISNIYLNTGTKNLILNYAQFSIPGSLPEIRFPVALQPEQKVTMLLDRSKLISFLESETRKGMFKTSMRLRVAVTDQTGGWHYHNTGCTIGALIRSTARS